jgi:mannose-1-phosphate guanylyltransferase/mannose-6-phosphate isomerase
MTSILPVILCGGSGTRLWPLSRAGFPKQFLVLHGTTSLFQQSVSRAKETEIAGFKFRPPLVITNEEHRFLAAEQLREIDAADAELILEPVAKNTAPALTLAALRAVENGDDPVLLVLPADQVVSNMAAFKKAVQSAVAAAENGAIVTLGIKPTEPATGYGYLQLNSPALASELQSVEAFVEKPALEQAKQYFDAGNYLWNAGIFILKASQWLAALESFQPAMLERIKIAWAAKTTDNGFTRPDKDAFDKVTSDSIDYAVMERCSADVFPIKTVALDAGWSDLGSWDAVWGIQNKDIAENVAIGDVVLSDVENSMVHASSRLVAMSGVNDIAVVETPDAVMITRKSDAQGVKRLVESMELQKRPELSAHRRVPTPWGWYDSIDNGERFQVKRIGVSPGASLSLQMHHHRAEHWIVVKGKAEVTCGNKIFMLSENQSTYIPIGEVHRLKNPGQTTLEIIEVQSGSYLGEDDIVRYEDSYGRAGNNADSFKE